MADFCNVLIFCAHFISFWGINQQWEIKAFSHLTSRRNEHKGGCFFHGEAHQEITALTMCVSCRGKAPSEAFQTVGDSAPFKDTSEESVDLVMKGNLLNLGGKKKRLLRPCGVSLFRCKDLPQRGDVSWHGGVFFVFFFEEKERRSYVPTPRTIEKCALGAIGGEDQTFALACLTRPAPRTNCSGRLADTGAGGHTATERKYTHQNPNICAPSVLRAETRKSPVAGGKKNTEREGAGVLFMRRPKTPLLLSLPYLNIE